MADTFKSVKRSAFQRAFAIAHFQGHTNFDCPTEQRKHFREIAKLLWDASGEETPMPAQLSTDLTALGAK